MARRHKAAAALLVVTAAASDGRPIPEIPPKVRHPRKELLVRHHPMFGRRLSLDDWPFLSHAIQRSRTLPLGTRIACLIEGEEDIRAKELAFWDLGGDVFQLTFLTQRPDALYFPNSLLADGRNYLYAAAAMWELQLGQRYLYYIIMDADAEAKDWSISWSNFQQFLRTWQPAVGLPALYEYEEILRDYPSTNDDKVRSVMNFDHQVLAVHSDASVWLLPYQTQLDQHCQWVSQWRFSSLANAFFPEHTLLTHKVSVGNPHHASYSKSRCLDLMQSCTADLRAEHPSEFHSCFLDPSVQALVVDGLPRRSAYLPWFHASHRGARNYSEAPKLQNCDDQPVAQAVRQQDDEAKAGGGYSWCRGCPLSVAFALLQAIVVARPYDFTSWVKMANLLAKAAARKEDLIASHVAFTVASRLVWCANGLRATDLNAEELKDFYQGHDDHGIFVEQNSQTLQGIEDSIVHGEEGVVYNGIRAALSPFEERAGDRVRPMISEKNVKTLVTIVKYCDDPGKYAGLLQQGQ